LRHRLTRYLNRGLSVAAAAFLLAALLPWTQLARTIGRLPGEKVALAAVGLICAVTAMLLRRHRRPDPPTGPVRPLQPISWWWMLAAAAAVAAIAWGTTTWLLAEADHVGPATEQAKARIDAVRTGFATAGGLGAAVGLLLAFRRQHHTEIVAAGTDHDASEKRITELYVKAADQLGSDKAAVRLAGLYALERLAQGNPAHRQTIVDVLCAYLRMPHTPPSDDARAPAAPDTTHANDSRRDTGTTAPSTPTPDPREEREVRLTAQRLLTDHLTLPGDTTTPTTAALTPSVADPFWPGMRINLDGAYLETFDLRDGYLAGATFSQTTFDGDALFDGATFGGHALFDGATFGGGAVFGGATFGSYASFGRAAFGGGAWFGWATFGGGASFFGAMFDGDALFDGATFGGGASFDGATFRGATEGLLQHDALAGWTLEPVPDQPGWRQLLRPGTDSPVNGVGGDPRP
jgi:hypothetical protein